MKPNQNNHKGGVASLSHQNQDQNNQQLFSLVEEVSLKEAPMGKKRPFKALSLALVSSMVLSSPYAIAPVSAEPNTDVLRLYENSNQTPASMCFSMTKKQTVLNNTNNLSSFIEVRDLGPSSKLSPDELNDIRLRGRPNLSKEQTDRLTKTFASLASKGTVINASPNVTNDQLCVTNLKHGNTYVLTLKKGLQFKSGESLNEQVNVPFNISDSLAQITLPRNNILPKNRTNNVITLRTVNQPAVRLAIYRLPASEIGTRGVSGLLSVEDGSTYIPLNLINDKGVRVLDRVYNLTNNTFTSLEDIANSNNQSTSEVNQVLNDASKIRLGADQLNKPILTEIKVGDFVKENDSGIYLIVMSSPKLNFEAYSDSYLSSAAAARNLFTAKALIVSDIGVSTYLSNDGILVNTRSFTTAKTMPNLEVSLFARNGDLLAKTKTDNNGVAKFDKSVIQGTKALTPTSLVVMGNDDSFYQNLTETPLYIESNTGATNTTGYETFAYTDRGIYRSGETVHYTALVRDKDLNAVDLPLTLQILNPAGSEVAKTLLDKAKAGGYEYDFTLPKGINNGSYQAILKLGDKVLENTVFSVGAYVPTQINTELTNNESILPVNTTFKLKSKTNFNYGGAASNLPGSFTVLLKPDEDPVPAVANAAGNPNLKSYHFGPDLRKLSSLVRSSGYNDIKTDVLGVLQKDITLKPADFPQIAQVTTNIYDPNGQNVSASKNFKVIFNNPLIGIMPIESNGKPVPTVKSGEEDTLDTNLITSSDEIGFSLCSYLQDGSTFPQDVKYYIYKELVDYNFVYKNGRWDYVRYVSRTPLTQGSVKVDNQNLDKALFTTNLPDGRYVIELESDKSKTTYSFTKAFTSSVDANAPDRIQLFADKNEYNVGDKAKLSFYSPFDGTASLALGSNGISDFKTFDVSKGQNEITVDITDKFEPQGHALLSIFSPQNTDKIGVSRAVGIVDLNLNHDKNKLNVALDIPSEVKPNTTLDVKVKALPVGENAPASSGTASTTDASGTSSTQASAQASSDSANADANNADANKAATDNTASADANATASAAQTAVGANGDARYAKVTLVDTGILDITGYKAPNPNSKLFQDRKYNVNLLDAYNYVMNDPRQQGQGYDEYAKLSSSAPPGLEALPYKLVALASKIVPLNADGTADVKFDVPQFSGRLKVMAVAWDKDKTGSADSNILIRDNAVATLGLPRYLNIGDEVSATLNLHNLKATNPQFIYDVSCSGAIQCSLQGTSSLKPGIREDKNFTITAASQGVGHINLKVINPDFKLNDSYDLTVTVPTLPMVRSYNKLVAAGQTDGVAISKDFNKLSGLIVTTSSLPNVNPEGFIADLNDSGMFTLSGIVSTLEAKLLYGDRLIAKQNATNAAGASDEAADTKSDKANSTSDTSTASSASNDEKNLPQYSSQADLNRDINELIIRILSRQRTDGSFGSNDFDNIYTTKVLLMADKLGYTVNADALNNALSNITDISLRYSTNAGAFASSVLAQFENVDLASLRQVAFKKDLTAPLTRAYLADALYDAGDVDRARHVLKGAVKGLLAWQDALDNLNKAYEQGLSPEEIYSKLSDIYRLYNVVAKTDIRHDAFVVIHSLIKAGMNDDVSLLINKLAVLTESPDYLSPLTMAAMLDANAYVDGTYKKLGLNGTDSGDDNANNLVYGSAVIDKAGLEKIMNNDPKATDKTLTGTGSILDKLSLTDGKLTFKNDANSTVFLNISALGDVKRENVISDKNIEVNINYYDAAGTYFSPNGYSLVKNEEVLMEVIYNNSRNTRSNELLKVKLPAGFEFVRFANKNDPTFSSLMENASIETPRSIQNSDDMVYASFDGESESVSLYIVLRAAQSGTFNQGEALMQLESNPDIYGSYLNNEKFTIKSQDK